jgi:hypothetical protein
MDFDFNPDVELREDPKPEETTCWTCPAKDTCEFAFDGYNTNGDCLENK